MIRTLLALLVVVPVLSAAYVRADVAPPDDYKELCTLARTCPNGQECVLCPADHSELDVCGNNLAEQGFAMKCKSWGASVWNEIWCRNASDEDDASTAAFTANGSSAPLKVERCKASSAPETDSDCSCRAPGKPRSSDNSHQLLLGAAAAIVLLFTRTRRPR